MAKTLVELKAELLKKHAKVKKAAAAAHREELKVAVALRQHAKQEQAEEETQLGVLAYAAGLRLTRVGAAVLSEAFLWLATVLPTARPWEVLRGGQGGAVEPLAPPENGHHPSLASSRPGQEG